MRRWKLIESRRRFFFALEINEKKQKRTGIFPVDVYKSSFGRCRGLFLFERRIEKLTGLD